MLGLEELLEVEELEEADLISAAVHQVAPLPLLSCAAVATA